MQATRALLRRGLRRLGLEKIHHPSFVDLLIHEGVEIVLDVGANEGHYGLELRERGFKGQILSFEPISSVFDVLATRCRPDPLWRAYRTGVGDVDGDATISVSAATVFSSFKAPTEYTKGKFAGACEDRRKSFR